MSEYEQLSFDFMTDFEDTVKLIGKLGTFKTKICIKCKKELEATTEYFCKDKNSKDKLRCHCKQCHTKLQINSRNSKDKNLCLYCSKLKLPQVSTCLYHAIYTKLKNQIKHGRFTHIKTKGQIRFYVEKLIKKLEQQDYKCAITGIPIEVGKNAQLDHIKEIVNGGSCQLDNLQWVDAKANRSKSWKYKND